MQKQDNIFDKFAGPCSQGILISFPLIAVGALLRSNYGPTPLILAIMFFFFSFGLSFIFQNLADGIRHNIKETMYVMAIPCQITDYTIEKGSSFLEKPVLTPLDAQYAPFICDTYLDMQKYHINSTVEVRLTPEMDFNDCFIATEENLKFDKSIRVIGIIMVTIGIFVPFIYKLFS